MGWWSLRWVWFAFTPRVFFLAVVLLLYRGSVHQPQTAGAPMAVASRAQPAALAGTHIQSGPLRARGTSTDGAAARFLAQATFGPTLGDIARVRQLGYQGWLDEQFAATPSYHLAYLDELGPNTVYELGQGARMEAWFMSALGGQDPFNPALVHRDQLRQRVAFALSEILVVSDQNPTLNGLPDSLASYYDVLVRNAFGNYRQLLEEVTLHPAMGVYLSAQGNRKPDPALNIRPDENFARESMQLFSIGLVQLNPDGTPLLNAAGAQIPTYDQFTVKGFAHVYTGWNLAGCEDTPFDQCWYYDHDAPAWRSPMSPYDAQHDSAGSKQLLKYPGVALANGVLPAGGNARSDLKAALDNVFRHPNVGPFIGRQLIQRLVTSNPTPAYVQRVASVFGNNGQGVRGDLRAVVRAVLLDDDARNGHLASPTTFGRLRDPITKLVRLWRVAPGRSINGRVFQYSHPEDEFAQLPLSAPSVFNFFKPDFAQPGEIRDLGLVSPEFQIHTDTQLVSAPNYLGWRVFLFWDGTNYSVADADEETLMDYAALRTLAADPAALVDHLDLVMMSGQMSEYMRDLLIDRLNGPLPDQIPGLTGGTTEQRRSLFRVQQALYLIVNSPEFSIQR